MAATATNLDAPVIIHLERTTLCVGEINIGRPAHKVGPQRAAKESHASHECGGIIQPNYMELFSQLVGMPVI